MSKRLIAKASIILSVGNLMKMNPVVHFEMPAKDKGRMRKFYEIAFGWQTEQLGEEMGEYVLVTTTESDEKTGLPRRPGAINGGFYQRADDPLFIKEKRL